MNFLAFVSAAIRALHAFYALAGSGTLTSSGLLGLPGGPLLSNALAELRPQFGIRTLPHVFGQHITRGIKSIADVVSLRLSVVVIPFPSVLNETSLSQDSALASGDPSSPDLVPGLTADNVTLWTSSNETFEEPRSFWSTSVTPSITLLPVCEFKGLELPKLDVCAAVDQPIPVVQAVRSTPSVTSLPICEFKLIELPKLDVCAADEQPTSVDHVLGSTPSATPLPTCEFKVLELDPPELCAAGDRPTSVDIFRPQDLASIPLRDPFACFNAQDFTARFIQLLRYVYPPPKARLFYLLLVSFILWTIKGRLCQRKPRHVFISLDQHLLDNVLLVNLSPPEMHGPIVLDISLPSSAWLPFVPSTLLPLLPSKKGNEHTLLTVLPLNDGEEDHGHASSALVSAPDAAKEVEHAIYMALLPVGNEEPIGYTARIHLPPIRLGKGNEHDLLTVLPLVNNEEDLVRAANTPLPAPDAEEEFEHALLVSLPSVNDEEALGHAIAMSPATPGADEVFEYAMLMPSPPSNDEELVGYTASIHLSPIRH
ncbi:hypothetical protein CONPUDRAFT_154133 [Coniophora puteana RWD-64-598 SS2]|uniref:Uncharacterized protein n=1 Tax=Coniophora puteana (strain RWD-64-598) TaxID=741705 RepID=A0A5M3MSU5_CONPW|nr:uncharacterized protein CONPUDRAFT_154133 [Coniophora puteana RWD-64-598 SS2]EIW81601.1 hypothetical protein CONPUDRAFT_154133 [Coniophora puteana RWD-64-598 SS2]